jgi:lysozyme
MLRGIDVSSHQGAINWTRVAQSGISFAFIKVTEGVGYRNPYFTSQWNGAKAAGITTGTYHYARPDLTGPEAEADYFLDNLPSLEPGDSVVLDMEAGYGNLLDWTLRWLRRVESVVGFKPIFYSGFWFMQPHGLIADDELSEYGLWYASYQSTRPPTPAKWPFIAVWQFSASSIIPGVNGPCDENSFEGTIEQFRAYGKPGGAPIEPDWKLTDHTMDTLVTDIEGKGRELAGYVLAWHADQAVKPEHANRIATIAKELLDTPAWLRQQRKAI